MERKALLMCLGMVALRVGCSGGGDDDEPEPIFRQMTFGPTADLGVTNLQLACEEDPSGEFTWTWYAQMLDANGSDAEAGLQIGAIDHQQLAEGVTIQIPVTGGVAGQVGRDLCGEADVTE